MRSVCVACILLLALYGAYGGQNASSSADSGAQNTAGQGITELPTQAEAGTLQTEETNTELETSPVPALSPTEESQLVIPEEPTDTPSVIRPISVWDTIRVFFVLGIVLFGIYGIVWFLKKVQRRSFAHSEAIDVLSSRTLSGGGTLHLIALGKSIFLIGASTQQVTLIKEINDKEAVDEIQLSLSTLETAEAGTRTFAQRIHDIFTPKKSQKAQHATEGAGSLQATWSVIKSAFGTYKK